MSFIRIAAAWVLVISFAAGKTVFASTPEPPRLTDQPALLEFLLTQNEAAAKALHSFKLFEELEFRDSAAPAERQDETMTIKALRTDDGRAAFEFESTVAAYNMSDNKFLGKRHDITRSVVDRTSGAVLTLRPDPQTQIFEYDSVKSIPQSAAFSLFQGGDHRYELYGFGPDLKLREQIQQRTASNTTVERRNDADPRYVIAFNFKRNNARYMEVILNPKHNYMIERWTHLENGNPSFDLIMTPGEIQTNDGKKVWLPTVVEQRENHGSAIVRGYVVKIRYEAVNLKVDDDAFKPEALGIPDDSPIFRTLPSGKLDTQYRHNGKLISQEEHNAITYRDAVAKRVATQPALAAKYAAILHPVEPRQSHLWIWLISSAAVVIVLGILWRRSARMRSPDPK